ncbi:UNVERIFIED_CONTAM: PiggyBac transposable element-derived protein 4 [Trichonephila clavipes]
MADCIKDGDVYVCEKDKLTTSKPKIVADYNRHMGYVDLRDRMSSTYSFARRTRKWTKKLFFSLIDIAVLNVFRLGKNEYACEYFTLRVSKHGVKEDIEDVSSELGNDSTFWMKRRELYCSWRHTVRDPIIISPENSALDNPAVLITRPHPCRVFDVEIITAVPFKEEMLENDDNVNVANF